MIGHLRIRNFKCFQDERVELSPLTLIVGANGVGKSSLLQSILLIQQATESTNSEVSLNGPFNLDLGTVADVVCQSVRGASGARDETTTMTIEAGLDTGTHSWTFSETDSGPFVLSFQTDCTGDLATRFSYLCAERIGPRDTQEVSPTSTALLNVGVRGEYTAHVLADRGFSRVRSELLHPRTVDAGNVVQLTKQTELWMQDIAPGVQIRANAYEGTNVAALRLKRGGLMTEWLRPPNIGFGVSYALPIIVAGLLAPVGSLLLVENPEAHLHPAGQSRMGRFLSTLASAGVQVIVETHSDHVLNGILLATVDSHPLRFEQVAIQYFHGDDAKDARAQAIGVTARGGLTEWPAGFFDQSEKDMAAILEARRRV